jgi:hypothetical protein
VERRNTGHAAEIDEPEEKQCDGGDERNGEGARNFQEKKCSTFSGIAGTCE